MFEFYITVIREIHNAVGAGILPPWAGGTAGVNKSYAVNYLVRHNVGMTVKSDITAVNGSGSSKIAFQITSAEAMTVAHIYSVSAKRNDAVWWVHTPVIITLNINKGGFGAHITYILIFIFAVAEMNKQVGSAVRFNNFG